MSTARRTISSFLALIALTVTTAGAHEFWIEPSRYHLTDGDFSAQLRVGQSFAGAAMPYLTHEIARSEVHHQGQVTPLIGQYGDIPALNAQLRGDGLHLIIHQTQDNRVRYRDDATFEAFADEKGYPGLLTQHRARYPDGPIIERYYRYAKSLVTLNRVDGDDTRVGMPIEIVLDENPYQSRRISGQLFGPTGVLANHRVTRFSKPGDGLEHTQTDVDGRFEFAWPGGTQVLVDAVIIRPLADSGPNQPRWESLWASLTFGEQ